MRPKVPFPEASVPIDHARRMVWNTGNILLVGASSRSEAANELLGSEIARMFARLDVLDQEVVLMQRALGENAMPVVPTARLINDIDRELSQITTTEQLTTGVPVNPFAIRDERFHALSELRFGMEVSYESITH